MTSPHWPLTGLRLRTPRLELRWPTLSDLDELAELAVDGVHDPGVQPFGVAWTDTPAAGLPSRSLRYYWAEWGAWRLNDWTLHLVAVHNGVVVGTQAMRGRNFALLRRRGIRARAVPALVRPGAVTGSGTVGAVAVVSGREGDLAVARYRRVVVKLSGEALAGQAGTGVDPASLAQVAGEVLSVHDLGVQVAVVLGGGNYFRGRMADGWGIGRAEADNLGMLGTVMNALMLRGVLTARTDTDVRVMTAMPMQSVAEPFIRLRAVRHLDHGLIVLLAGGIGQPYVTTDYPAVQRALELSADALLVAKRGVDGVYDSDPNVNPGARRYSALTYDEALAAKVRIMDTSAFVLANEQGLTMHIFDVAAVGVMRRICEGDDLGTRISDKP